MLGPQITRWALVTRMYGDTRVPSDWSLCICSTSRQAKVGKQVHGDNKAHQGVDKRMHGDNKAHREPTIQCPKH